jgi:hypothetical protein
MKHKKEFLPQDTAVDLCTEIRIRNQQKRWPLGIGKVQCYFCWYFGKKAFQAGDPTKLCAFSSDDNRGCWQVNRMFDRQVRNREPIQYNSSPVGD